MGNIEELGSKTYRGIWRILIRAFRVPYRPPVLPTRAGEQYEAFKPAKGFLRYMKFWFWFGMVIVLAAEIVGLCFGYVAEPFFAFIGGSIGGSITIATSLLAYLAIYLRFDTTWYVFNERSMRLRRGIWTIRESTITFENVQNVKISQGPVQRLFGIFDLVVETAGGGQSLESVHHQVADHVGLIEGVQDAKRIQQMILSKLRKSNSAGLGDEGDDEERTWSTAHLKLLREIRDVAKALENNILRIS